MEDLPVGKNAAPFSNRLFTQNRTVDWGRTLLSLLALAVITFGSFWAAFNPGWVQTAGHWGYLGAALISFLSSATVLLPAPGLAVVFSMGSVLDPVLLGLVAGVASGLGELSGYIAGASGRALIRDKHMHPFVRRFASEYTAVALFVLALLPLPIFDVAGIIAGAMRMRLPVFLGAVIPGKVIKHICIALMGAGSLPLLQQLLG